MAKELKKDDRDMLIRIRDNIDIEPNRVITGHVINRLMNRGLVRSNQGAPQGYSLNDSAHRALMTEGLK